MLIVEDDPLHQMMAGNLVDECGLAAICAGNADQALTILESRDDISLVLTDVEMPGSMDGLMLVALIHRRWPPIQLIVVSGNVLRENVDLPPRGRFINKPYPPHELVYALKLLTL